METAVCIDEKGEGILSETLDTYPMHKALKMKLFSWRILNVLNS